MLDGVVDRRRAGDVAAGLGLGDDAAGQRELRVAERVAGGVDVEASGDRTVVPLEVREVVRGVDVDQRQVVALRDAEDGGVVAVVELAADVDLERRRTGDDVVVRDGEAVGADDEAAAEARAVGEPDLRVAERALGDDLHDRRLDVAVRGDAAGSGRVRRRAVVGDRRRSCSGRRRGGRRRAGSRGVSGFAARVAAAGGCGHDEWQGEQRSTRWLDRVIGSSTQGPPP